MKFLCIGDLHGKKTTIDKIEKVLMKALELSKEVDIIVFLGDLNDTKAIIRSEVQNLYSKYLDKFQKKIYLIVGNHDYENSIECKGHSLEVFKNKPYISVIDSVVFTEGVFFAPYYHDLEKFREDVAERFNMSGVIGRKWDKIIFMHQGIDGVSYSNGQTEISDLKPSFFKEFDTVISGHIHKQQKHENIFYLGSPFTQNFGETDEEKNICIFDSETKEIKLIDLDIPKHKVYEHEIKDTNEIKDIKKIIKKFDNVILQLRITCPESISSKIKMSLFKGCNINSLKVFPKREDKRVLVKPTFTKEKMMEIYINNLDTTLDKKELIELNNKILREVK